MPPRKLGHDWDLVNLAVTFANDGDPAMVGEPIKEDRPNYHGRTRLTCKLTGECDLGCNHGSKNSLDYTYITAAMHEGADIRTRHEVRGFEPRDGGGYKPAVRHPRPRSRGRGDRHVQAREAHDDVRSAPTRLLARSARPTCC